MRKELVYQQNNNLLDPIFEQLNVYKTLNKDIIHVLQKDTNSLNTPKSYDIDWQNLELNLKSKVYDDLSVIFIAFSFLVFFLPLAFFIYSSLFMLFIPMLLTFPLMLPILQQKEITEEQQCNLESSLYIEIIPKDNMIHALFRTEDSIIRQEIFSLTEEALLQETVIGWEEEIKQYQEILNDIQTEYYINNDQEDKTLKMLTDAFDKNITKVSSQTLPSSNQSAKNSFKRKQKLYKRVFKVTKISFISLSLITLTGGTLSIISKFEDNSKVENLTNNIKNFKTNYIKQHNNIPTQEKVKQFIKTQNMDGITTNMQLTLNPKEGYKDPKEGYYIKVSPEKTLLPNIFSWEREKTKIIDIHLF